MRFRIIGSRGWIPAFAGMTMLQALAIAGVFLYLLAGQASGWTRTDTLRVLANNDDVRMIAGSFSATGTLYHGRTAGDGICSTADRMMSKIPAGQTISSAYFVPAALSQAGTCTTRVFLENSNNPAQITSAGDFNGRTLTTDSITIIGGSTWTEGTRYPYDITTMMQAVYNAGYCDSGEYVIAFWLGRNLASADHYRTTYAYDQDPGVAGWIIVTHETAAAGSNRRRQAILLGEVDQRFPVLSQWEFVP